MDIARGEMVEGELDRLIERRSRQKDPDEERELWKESVRTYEEQRQQMARLEWHAFHCRLRGTGQPWRLSYSTTRARRRS